MNLYRINDTVLNLERINGVYDLRVPQADAPAGQRILRVVFDNAQIDLTGDEARVFRRWFRHSSKNLTPHKDEEGAELVSPEDQVKRSLDALLVLIDHSRPRDPAVRQAARRLADLIDYHITGELLPARASEFEKTLVLPHEEQKPVENG
jgi:hypothetical protein